MECVYEKRQTATQSWIRQADDDEKRDGHERCKGETERITTEGVKCNVINIKSGWQWICIGHKIEVSLSKE